MDSHESLLIRYERSVRVNSSFFSAYSKPLKCILNEMVAQLQRLPFLLMYNIIKREQLLIFLQIAP